MGCIPCGRKAIPLIQSCTEATGFSCVRHQRVGDVISVDVDTLTDAKDAGRTPTNAET